MLPHMKLGLDRRTGLNRFITSWKSPEDPGTGEYSFKLDVSGSSQLFLSMGSEWIWRTGPWNGLGFVGVPEMLTTFIFDIRFWNTVDEVSMEFTVVNSSSFSSIKLGSDGLYQRYTLDERNHQLVAIWSAARDPCDNYGRCGPNSNCDVYTGAAFECTCLAGFEPKSQRDWSLRDGSGGCERSQGTNTCRSGEGFIKIAGVKPPDASTARVNDSLNLEGCEKECLNDCNCRAYATANVSAGGSGCLSWYGDLMDIRTLSQGGQDLFVRVEAIILDETKKSMLAWNKRFEIIIGIARGTLYLHQHSRLRIIHRDLKASNILLDIDMIPKILDCGMARLFGKNQIEGSTNRVVGTYGYMSPEYAMEGLFSIKSDVYSFGVLLLEIITERRNTTYYYDSPFNLVGYVWSLWREDKALDIVDPSLEKSNHANEVLRCIQIGLICVQESAIDRPTMLTVIFMLAENQKQSKGFLAKKGMMAVLVVGATVIMVLLISTYWFLRKKMKGRGKQNKMLYNLRPSATWLEDSLGAKEHDESTTNSKLQFFDMNTIAAATNNFSSENKLGRGGFGSVYKILAWLEYLEEIKWKETQVEWLEHMVTCHLSMRWKGYFQQNPMSIALEFCC